MTRLILPTRAMNGAEKKEAVEKILAAAEAARKLHNALYAARPEVDMHEDKDLAAPAAAWQERLDAVSDLENELLEHAMRITLG